MEVQENETQKDESGAEATNPDTQQKLSPALYFDLEDQYGNDGSIIKESSIPSVLNAYLTDTTTAFGLNLKQWVSTSSGKTITKNSSLKKMINA